jgi:hypothetical protein
VALFAAGCHHGRRKVQPPPPPRHESFLGLDREHQRLVRDYQPVSSALTAYERSFRDWRLGRLSQAELLARAGSYRQVVRRAIPLLEGDRATGETVHAKRLLVAALGARSSALAALPDLDRYRPDWYRSVVKARAALTVLQDIRDRARLIPLPEDAVS